MALSFPPPGAAKRATDPEPARGLRGLPEPRGVAGGEPALREAPRPVAVTRARGVQPGLVPQPQQVLHGHDREARRRGQRQPHDQPVRGLAGDARARRRRPWPPVACASEAVPHQPAAVWLSWVPE